ncbi:hypothetical protein M446_4119 [Methylobacterium sp. 4-46]|uniref:hypothetical protein n=1 Tax=unclassified Methylobacterium TaxID=2615210 RepID=UPI000152E895|nr:MULTISPECIES: hypothetical protein [Methylobacterium]ACA18476.1 hypothetical protein M446_4119 [Methylobacterium sp. 4-46]WFT77765.1 hypothetical protein QA634_20920 [Methylobacterium nodulans]
MTKFEQATAIQQRAQQIISGLTVVKATAGYPGPGVTDVPIEVRVGGMGTLAVYQPAEAAKADALFAQVEAALAPIRARVASDAEADLAALFAS